MNAYSDKLYGSLEGIEMVISVEFLSLAEIVEFCLIESESLASIAEKIE